jgi:hypothetical protein
LKVFVDLRAENVLNIHRTHVDCPDCDDCASFDGCDEQFHEMLVLEYLLWGSIDVLADRNGAGKANSSGKLLTEGVRCRKTTVHWPERDYVRITISMRSRWKARAIDFGKLDENTYSSSKLKPTTFGSATSMVLSHLGELSCLGEGIANKLVRRIDYKPTLGFGLPRKAPWHSRNSSRDWIASLPSRFLHQRAGTSRGLSASFILR